MTTSGENNGNGNGEDTGVTQVDAQYGGSSQVQDSAAQTEVELVTNALRTAVSFKGHVKQPRRFREALSALYAVVSSDYRYKPKDRTAYLAYRQMLQRTASQELWRSQQAYYRWILVNDISVWFILDPIVSIHPDGMMFEVFSKDEGSYAHLAIDWSAFEVDGDLDYGTTNIDFTPELFEAIQKIRSYRSTVCSVGRDAVELSVGEDAVIEKSVRVNESWLRGFLQVQSAGTLPRTTCELTAIDFYNLLRTLRLNADRKGEGRAIRFELVPGEQPRIVLEPWEEVIEAQGAPYTGEKAEVIRVWGRRRLLELRRFLPLVEKVTVHMLGSGLPNFWVLEGGAFRMTLGMTGFTSYNWSEAIEFDQMLPRSRGEDPNEMAVVEYLKTQWVGSLTDVAEGTNLDPEEALRALQAACQMGAVMFDLVTDSYRYRPVLDAPLDRDKYVYRNHAERQAADLVALGAVKISKSHSIPGGGTEIVTDIEVAADRRSYQTTLRLGSDGRFKKGQCTCKLFRDQGFKHGPCAHLLASRVHWGHDLAARRAQCEAEPDSLVFASRTFATRKGATEERVQLTLDHKRLRVEWGLRGEKSRLQNLVFNKEADARDAYLARIDKLERRGYMDASSA